MAAPCLCFHKTVFAVFTIKVKGAINQNDCCDNTKTDAHPLVDASHIHDDEHDEQSEQPACEYKEVLRFQSLKFRRFAYSFVN